MAFLLCACADRITSDEDLAIARIFSPPDRRLSALVRCRDDEFIWHHHPVRMLGEPRPVMAFILVAADILLGIFTISDRATVTAFHGTTGDELVIEPSSFLGRVHLRVLFFPTCLCFCRESHSYHYHNRNDDSRTCKHEAFDKALAGHWQSFHCRPPKSG